MCHGHDVVKVEVVQPKGRHIMAKLQLVCCRSSLWVFIMAIPAGECIVTLQRWRFWRVGQFLHTHLVYWERESCEKVRSCRIQQHLSDITMMMWIEANRDNKEGTARNASNIWDLYFHYPGLPSAVCFPEPSNWRHSVTNAMEQLSRSHIDMLEMSLIQFPKSESTGCHICTVLGINFFCRGIATLYEMDSTRRP